MALNELQRRVWAEAKANGYDDEAAGVAVAVATAEGLGSDHPGDAGHSVGNYQFYFGGGAGDVWAKTTGHTKAELTADPFLADNWWHRGPLADAIAQARKMGLSGADLARVAGKIAERPAEGNEWNYAAAYAQIFGNVDLGTIGVDTPGPSPLPKGVDTPDVPRDRWWELGDTPPVVTQPAEGNVSPDARFIGASTQASAKATQQVAEAISPLTAIAKFFTDVLPSGSNLWIGLEITFAKLIATIIVSIILIAGVLRATGGDKAIKGAAETAVKVAAVA